MSTSASRTSATSLGSRGRNSLLETTGCADLHHSPGLVYADLSARERRRQPEPWEHAVIEAGDGADPVAGEGEDEEAGSVADAAGRGAQVRRERRLTIGSRRHEVMRSARADDAGVEAGHGVAALVFEGNWWHGDEDVGGEQGEQRVDIRGVVRADELCDKRLLGG